MSWREIYNRLRNKEVNSWWRKYYPLKSWLLVPNYFLPQWIQILKDLYLVLRQLDDICDWDTLEYSEDIFIEWEKITNLVDLIISGRGGITFQNPLIRKLLDILTQIYEAYWLKVLESVLESINFWYQALVFDKSRIDNFWKWNPVYQSEEEIKKRLLELELYWVLRPILVLLWNKGFDIKDFEEMILLTRWDYYYSRDIVEDTDSWLFNYDVDRFPTRDQARSSMTERGKRDIDIVTQETSRAISRLTLTTRVAIQQMYLEPAKKYFSNVT